MKKITKLFFVLIFVYLISCVTETENQRIDYNFEIRNNSGKNIRVNAFKNHILTKKIDIFNNTTYNKSFISSSMDRAYSFSDVLGGDSIKVIYNKEKFKIFYCFLGSGGDGCDIPRNILNEVNDFDSSESVFFRIYEFLEQDYENAEDCNGNCE